MSAPARIPSHTPHVGSKGPRVMKKLESVLATIAGCVLLLPLVASPAWAGPGVAFTNSSPIAINAPGSPGAMAT